MQPKGEFSRPINLLDAAADADRSRILTANSEERAALARRLGLAALSRFEVQVTVEADGKGDFVLRGEVQADIVQTCCVTLEPLPAHLVAPLSLIFTRSANAPDKELILDVEDEPPERLPENGLVDIGELAVQFLVLEIDPYPRKPGATFQERPESGGETGLSSPFAALASLQGKRPTET